MNQELKKKLKELHQSFGPDFREVILTSSGQIWKDAGTTKKEVLNYLNQAKRNRGKKTPFAKKEV